MNDTVIKNIKSYYDSLYSFLEVEMRPMTVYEKIIEYLNGKEGMKLLNVSCGTGNLIKCAEERDRRIRD